MVEIDGEPWFVAKDALSLMAYPLGSHGSIRRKLNRDEVGVHPLPTNLSDGRLQMRDFAVISESGLYKLVMRSDKKEAKQFQDWVTGEVLPSIRKTGTYTMPGAKNVPPYKN